MCYKQYKLCKVKKVLVGLKGVPSIVTSDGRTIRYPDPLIKVNDTVRVNIATGKIEEFVKFDSGDKHHWLQLWCDSSAELWTRAIWLVGWVTNSG